MEEMTKIPSMTARDGQDPRMALSLFEVGRPGGPRDILTRDPICIQMTVSLFGGLNSRGSDVYTVFHFFHIRCRYCSILEVRSSIHM